MCSITQSSFVDSFHKDGLLVSWGCCNEVQVAKNNRRVFSPRAPEARGPIQSVGSADPAEGSVGNRNHASLPHCS